MKEPQCTHTNVKFFLCTAADRLPAMWVCEDCLTRFNHDPRQPPSAKRIAYLLEPNEKNNKEPPQIKSSKW
jgi:hypothetical protein